MSDLDLGFVEERDAAWLSNCYFPSKLGGLPAWLELESLPTIQQLQCSKCLEMKSFLCQLYAPYEDEFNFHRSIYLFVCRSKDCQQPNRADSLTVLRSQLPRKNQFYSEQAPPEDDEPLPAIPSLRKLCAACGCHAPLACSRCKAINYCCSKHQRAHWPQHKPQCGQPLPLVQAKRQPLKDIEFPEFEIVMESHSTLPEEEEDKTEATRLAEFEQLKAKGQTGELSHVSEAEMDKYFGQEASAVNDKIFGQFKKQIASEPEQIVRYKRGGVPLWITKVDSQVEDLPHCPVCGGERQFEFQIMPQTLTLLKDEHLDWGVLAVYTCKKSCSIQGYVEELVIKQDIVATD